MGQCSLKILDKDGRPGWKVITHGILRIGSGSRSFLDRSSIRFKVRALLMPFTMQFFG
jgi:hypothetical protein